MKKLITISFMLAVLSAAAQPWYWISPTTGHHRLNGISFANTAEAMAVGNDGVILYYDGETWSHMPVPVTENLQAIHFLSANFACAVGDNGTILHFNGLEWTQLSGPSQANLVDVCFVDESNGWAVGEEIWRFNGIEWQVDAPWQNFNTVHFYDVNEGWAGGINKLYKYDGAEWIAYDELTGPGADFIIFSISMTGPSSGWLSGTSIGGSNKFYEYNGTTWTMFGGGSGPCNGLSFSGHNDGFGITNTGGFFIEPNVAAYKITNGTWQKVYEPAFYNDFYLTAVEALAPGEAWVTDILGFIHHGIDDAWRISNGIASDTIHCIDFPEPPLGQQASFGMAACGINGIMRYDNAGWNAEFSDEDFRFNRINLHTPDFGFAASYKIISELIPPWNYEARIYQYNNGNWSLEDMGGYVLFSPVSDIFILHANQVWAASLNSLYHKTDGTWTVLDFNFEMKINALHFNSTSDGWWAGTKTDDGLKGIIYRLNGSDWASHYETETGGFNAFHVIDNNNIYAVGDYGLIAYYDGNSWIEFNPLVTKDLLTVHINMDNTGWAAGEDGTLLYFDGTQWSLETSLTEATIFDICFPETTFGLMSGAKGTFFATQPQLPVGINQPERDNATQAFRLSPNPAGDFLQVEFNISKAGTVKLEVYDLTGRKVLENSFRSNSNELHRETINIGSLKKRVYIVRVHYSDNTVQSAKLMVK
jgi:photosystem II stability/assembly factor-like uncharacterized protein